MSVDAFRHFFNLPGQRMTFEVFGRAGTEVR